MSLFDDDFYTTNIPKTTPWKRSWTRGGWKDRDKFVLVLISSASGVALTLLLLVAAAVAGWGPSKKEEPAAVPAMSMNDYTQWRSDQVVKAVDLVKPAVVSIVSSTAKDGDKSAGQSLGIGSGVIFQKSGNSAYIVTNNHVVQSASQVEVILASGERKKAAIKGKDTITDLAVLEIDDDGVKVVAEFGDSEQLKSGETAIAIGNPLGLGFAQTTTVGVISSPHRRIPISFSGDGNYDWEMDVIQTDAAINQGNSGGALVNLEGKVVGINSMKVSETGVEGLGFAIPINQVKETIGSLIKYGKVKRPYMGVTTDSVRSFKGVEILKLPENVKNGLVVIDALGPAKEAGLATNDVIVELDGKPMATNLALRQYLYTEKKIGDSLKVTYYRNGKKSNTTLTLGERKEE